MRSLTITDETVLLFGAAAPTDNTTVTTADSGVVVGYCTEPETSITAAATFVPFPDSTPNGNFRHGLGCNLCVQVTGTAVVSF